MVPLPVVVGTGTSVVVGSGPAVVVELGPTFPAQFDVFVLIHSRTLATSAYTPGRLGLAQPVINVLLFIYKNF